MRLTVPQIDISREEGFSKDKDIFNREKFGEKLANLFENSQEDIVVALDAQWGEGKSTFVKMWQGYVENHIDKKFKTIYFDAFVTLFAAQRIEINKPQQCFILKVAGAHEKSGGNSFLNQKWHYKIDHLPVPIIKGDGKFPFDTPFTIQECLQIGSEGYYFKAFLHPVELPFKV